MEQFLQKMKSNPLPMKDVKSIIKPFPLFSGIYFLLDKEGELVYVGQSTDLRKRIDKHPYNLVATHFQCIRVKPTMLNDEEAFYIHSLTPQLNKNLPHNNRFMSLDNIHKKVDCKTETLFYYIENFKIQYKEVYGMTYFDMEDFEYLLFLIKSVVIEKGYRNCSDNRRNVGKNDLRDYIQKMSENQDLPF